MKVILFKLELIRFDESESYKLSFIDLDKMLFFETWLNKKGLDSTGYNEDMMSDFGANLIVPLIATFESGPNNKGKLSTRLSELKIA